MSYSDAVGISRKEAEKEVGFGFLRENLISAEHSVSSGRDSIVRESDMTTLGVISQRRGLLPYNDLMTWMWNEFESSEIPFKLTESVVTGKGEMFQTYLFDFPMKTPDGQEIAPMAIAKASYIGRPFELNFGTYRFVCSNGAIVGNTLEGITVKAREIDNLMAHGLMKDIKHGLDSMKNVSDGYQRLADSSFDEYLNVMLPSTKVPTGLKKKSLSVLRDMGVISVPLMDESHSFKGEEFITSKPEVIYNKIDDRSGWDFYNDLTFHSTHNSRSVNTRSYLDSVISDVFQV